MTLFENSHDFDLGDVNHDGALTIGDVTALINRLLSGAGGCDICCDVNGNDRIDIGDVTTLVNILLQGHH